MVLNYVETSNPVMETIEEGKDHNPYETVALSNVMNDIETHINTSWKSEAQRGDLSASLESDHSDNDTFIAIEIISVYEGSKYSDTCISEIREL